MPDPVIRVDKTQPYATVHGDRPLIDPAYHQHYQQDGLPFDAHGVLLPDDGKTEPFTASVDGEVMRFAPLYSADMRAAVAEKMKRLKKVAVGKATTDPEHERDIRAAHDGPSADDVNFVSWLRGEADYEPRYLFAAWAARYGAKHTSKRALIEDAVFDQKLVPESDVAPALLKLAAGAQAAA